MVGRRLISTNSTTRCCDYPEVILPDFPRAGITMEIGRSRETRRSTLLLAVIYIFERSCFRSIRRGFHGFHGPVSIPPPLPLIAGSWPMVHPMVNDADPIRRKPMFDHRGSFIGRGTRDDATFRSYKLLDHRETWNLLTHG